MLPEKRLHPPRCACQTCHRNHPSDRKRARVRCLIVIAVYFAFLLLIPGRELLRAAWAALSPFLTR